MLITVHNLLRWGPGLQPVAEKPRASESRGSNSELPLKPITIPTLRADKIRKTSMFHLNKTGTNATFAYGIIDIRDDRRLSDALRFEPPRHSHKLSLSLPTLNMAAGAVQCEFAQLQSCLPSFRPSLWPERKQPPRLRCHRRQRNRSRRQRPCRFAIPPCPSSSVSMISSRE